LLEPGKYINIWSARYCKYRRQSSFTTKSNRLII